VRVLPFLLLSLLTIIGRTQSLVEHEVTYDLKSNWKIFSDGSFIDWSQLSSKDISTIYFEVDPDRYRAGSRINISGTSSISVYLNYQLLSFQSYTVSIDIDSLKAKVPAPWLFSVYQSKGLSWLQTEVISPPEFRADIGNSLRPPDYYLDFSIIASVLVFIFFIVLLRSNPRLTFDYFNFVRLFSIQEREDSLLNSRISSSANILYYIFCSLLSGLLLLTIFHFGGASIPLSESFPIHSIAQAFFQWLKLSGLVLLSLFIKLVLILGLARLFDFRDATSVQFYNYLRLAFFICVLAGIVCLCYFVFKIQSPEAYSFLLRGIIWIFILWLIVIGLKLLRRSSFRFFHLFSYLCASELISFFILVKVLNS